MELKKGVEEGDRTREGLRKRGERRGEGKGREERGRG